MKNVIKRILKEDFDWVDSVNPGEHYNNTESYVRWLNNNFGDDWKEDFDDAIHMKGYLTDDCQYMLDQARIADDPSQDMKDRVSAIEEIETYSSLGSVIENYQLYFQYVSGYSELSNLSEDDVHKLGQQILQKKLNV